MSTAQPQRHLSTLTVLRFFAAFLVLGYHFFSFPARFDFLNGIFLRGNLGVDFFFILSGFVLAYSYHSRLNNDQYEFSKLKFYRDRLARIAPVYYLALLLSIPVFLHSLNKLPVMEKNFSLSSIPLSLLFLQSFSGFEFTQKTWNVPAWSLSVEIFFYLIFPFLSYKILRNAKNAYKMLAGFLVLNALFYFSIEFLPVKITIAGTDFTTAFRNLPLYHLPTFFIGNCLALIYFRHTSLSLKKTLAGLSLFLLLSFIALSASIEGHSLPVGRPIIIMAFSGVIFFSALLDQYIGKSFPAFLVLLGEASYSLYILQVPVKFFLQQVWSKILHISYVDGFLFAGYLSVGSILISILSYKFVEIPMRNKIAATKK